MPDMREAAICLAALAFGCAARSPTISPAATRWLGCYVVSWARGDTISRDSFRVAVGKPTHAWYGPGFLPAWPKPLPFRAVSFGDTAFAGPWWSASGDSLVLLEGLLSTRTYTIHRQGDRLAGTLLESHDFSLEVRDSSG